ncbi:MAG: hypothetical protein A2007_02055 [Verrucomicrobia bacterium GWC2_42_7]|nr:MAG: hypothetical protein A2007_02055 [Verrucomicrobia bacterium GWC2_42_7]
MTDKTRVDELLVERGLCETRAQAKQAVLAGWVRVDGAHVLKPSKMLGAGAKLALTESLKHVSRAGDKLLACLQAFEIKVVDAIALDVGASTGGFTDCLLQKGAREVTCVDVGHGQLHPKLLKDSRVINFEKVNARYLSEYKLPHASYDLIVIDVSFISLTKILEPVWPFLKKSGKLIALIKPQFELDKDTIGRAGGVVKHAEQQEQVKETIVQFAISHLTGSQLIGSISSPITGTDGNREFLMALCKG